jgi:hypothetical protein
VIYGSEGKRFFLKKEAKTFTRLSRTTPRQPSKSFLVLFFKKEHPYACARFFPRSATTLLSGAGASAGGAAAGAGDCAAIAACNSSNATWR